MILRAFFSFPNERQFIECQFFWEFRDTFDFDTDRGKLCPMALHAGFPYIDILRYGGKPPLSRAGDIRFCCPDADVANVFRIQVE